MSNEELEEKLLSLKPMVKAVASRFSCYFSPAFDMDDAVQEGLISVIKAIQSYSEPSHLTLENYAFLCVKRNLIKKTVYMNKIKTVPFSKLFEEPYEMAKSFSVLEEIDKIINRKKLSFRGSSRQWEHRCKSTIIGGIHD